MDIRKMIAVGTKCAFALPGTITSDNAAEVLASIQSIAAQGGQAEVVLDAAGTAYLSSAGLRVLLALRNSGIRPEIVNVSPLVYDTFEVTGFTRIFPILRRMREISVDGLEVIGKGATSTVYRLDKDQIIKVFNEVLTLEEIQGEIAKTKEAFLKGIVTAISYDVVKVGNAYGAVY